MREQVRDDKRDRHGETLVLAALARAQRHRTAPGLGASRREIEAHLGLRPRSSAARAAAANLERLTAADAVRRERRHGIAVWRITARGRALLARAGTVTLPEAPQHRAWRFARGRAAAAAARLRVQLRGDLRDAARLLAAANRTSSDAWFELAERLARDAWLLGSATYCLREWSEPDDARADLDTGTEPGDSELPRSERERRRLRRAGRRNVALWER